MVAWTGAYLSRMRLRAGTFNVHHCEGPDGTVDVARTAAALARADADLIGLQELDRNLPRSGHEDQPAELAACLGMEVGFWPTLQRGDGGYGIGIASAAPIENARFVHLPRLGEEEPRGAVTAVYSGVGVVVTHLSTDRRARRVQLAALAAIVAGFDGPVILMGDFNLGPRSLGPLRRLGLAGAFGHSTLAARLVPRQIDHILVSPGIDLRRSWTIATEASDHLPLVADLEIPPGS